MQETIARSTVNLPDKHEPILEVRLLGAVEVLLGNTSLATVGSRKAQALFIYLVMTTKLVPRDTLATLFWPEMAETTAKNNLRTTLTKLKQELGPYLLITTNTIAFNRQLPYTLDVERMQTQMNAALAVQDLDGLQSALALYQGEFLQGFHIRGAEPFEEWMFQQREQLHLLVLQALDALIALSLQQGEYTTGMDAAHKLLALEPWSETTHRQLMTLLAMSGRRERALQQYESCRRILADELGIEPTPETTALYRQIQTGHFEWVDSIRADAPILHRELPITDRQSDYPKPDNLFAIRNNLLTSLATFIGRQDECAFLIEQVTAADCRLVTIIGPGGVGKSSLALAVAQRLVRTHAVPFDGIFFVALAGIEAAQDNTQDNAPGQPLITAVAQAIGCQFQGKRPLQAQLIDYLRQHRLLLILDNFEQLVEYTAIVVALLTNAPTLTMVITSRIRLNVRGETILTLAGLSLHSPAPVAVRHMAALGQAEQGQVSEAVALFVDRAATLDPAFALNEETFPLVAQICRAVAGLPLAIEMTAAWTSLYSCREIAERLRNEQPKAELLVSQYADQPIRHQSLQQVFDDSWEQLPTLEQWGLAQLSIFSNQFTHTAVEAITDVKRTNLAQLRDHSLLQVDKDRLYSLHPLIKLFAAQKWQGLTEKMPQQRQLLHATHSRYYLQKIAKLTNSSGGEEELATIDNLTKEHVEIVRSWQWAIQQNDWTQIQQSMAGFFRYLELTNQSTEGKVLFDVVNAQPDDPVTHWFQVAHCHFLRRLAKHEEARQRLEELVATISSPAAGRQNEHREMAADKGISSPMHPHTFALSVLGWIHYEQGNYDAAFDSFATAHRQAELTKDSVYLMETYNGLGAVAFSRKQYTTAHNNYQAALTHATAHNDLHYTAIILGNLAALTQATGTFAEAEHYLQMRLTIDRKTQNRRQMAVSYQRLGQLALLRAAYTDAEGHLHASLDLFEQFGNSPEMSHVLLDLSKSLLCQHRIKPAETHCLRSLQVAIDAKMTPRILSALTLLAEIRMAEEKKIESAILLEIVNHSTQIPAATFRKVQKLQAILATELGETTISSIGHTLAGQSLHEFGLSRLMQNNALMQNHLQFSMGGSDSSST